MNRVVILSRQADFSDSLCTELRAQTDCEIIASTDASINPEDAAVYSHQFIIVDADTLQEDLGAILLKLSRGFPDADIITFTQTCESADVVRFASFGVLEFLQRPIDTSQMRQSARQILEGIRSFNAAHAVHLRLIKEMRGNNIVAKSRPMRRIVEDLPRLANSNATVLIEGETGTGKDLVARAIHYLGSRAGKPFVTVDCGAIPESLVENELFGHMRGAYTGASENWRGLLREARGGTLYIDEIEALPLQMQTRFLHLLQTGEYRPLGQIAYQTLDARIIASTNVDLVDRVRRKEFREDLYHRLNVVHLVIPPLRVRKADIPPLVMHFARNQDCDREPTQLMFEEKLPEWMQCDWPGNVRELENRVQEWLIKGNIEQPSQMVSPSSWTAFLPMTLSSVRDEALDRSERSYLRDLLRFTEGNISRAARLAEVDRKNLSLLLKKRGVDPSEFRPR